MNTSPDFDRLIGAWLDDQAPMREPDGLFERVTTDLEQTSRLPAWRFPEKWLPMTLTARLTLAPPLRSAGTLLLIGLLAVALAVSLAVAGSQFLRQNHANKLNGGLMVPTLELDQVWGASAIAGLSQPHGLDVGPDGNLYVVNAGASEIIVVDPDGRLVRRWGERGSGDGQFNFQPNPTDPENAFGGVAVAPDGSVYVSDTVNDRVQQFDAGGEFVRTWGSYGSADGQFMFPYDLSVGPDGSVYVVDIVRDDIQRFSGEGDYLETIGGHGTADGQLSDTGGIVVDDAGALYNADDSNDRVQSWGADGTFRWAAGGSGSDGITLTRPADIAVDGDGNVYITERGGEVTVLTPDQALASTWTVPERDESDECCIAIGNDGAVYLSSAANDAIYKLYVEQHEPATDVASAAEASMPAPTLADAPAAPAAAAVPDGLSVGAPFAVPFTADMPPGWKVNWLEAPGGVELAKPKPDDPIGTMANVRVFVPTNAYADPCRSAGGPIEPPIGPGVDALAAALTQLPGFRVVRPITDITLDGYEGKTFDLEHAINSLECDDDPWLPQWTYASGAGQSDSGPGWDFHQRIAILDIDGTRVLVEAWTFTGTSRADVDEANAVFDSIDFQ